MHDDVFSLPWHCGLQTLLCCPPSVPYSEFDKSQWLQAGSSKITPWLQLEDCDNQGVVKYLVFTTPWWAPGTPWWLPGSTKNTSFLELPGPGYHCMCPWHSVVAVHFNPMLHAHRSYCMHVVNEIMTQTCNFLKVSVRPTRVVRDLGSYFLGRNYLNRACGKVPETNLAVTSVLGLSEGLFVVCGEFSVK